MIPNITRPPGAGGMVNYLLGPGKQDLHQDQRVITGTVGQEGPLTMAKEDRAARLALIGDLAATGRAFPEAIPTAGEFWHCSLSVAAGGREIADSEWKAIAHDFMEQMGFPADSRWVAVGHGLSANGNPHIHIAASLVTENGQRVSTWHDYKRSQRVCGELEQRYGLAVLETRCVGMGTPGLSRGELDVAAQTGEPPARIRLRDEVRAALGVSRTEGQFITELRSRARVHARADSAGRVVGYAVSADGKVWFPGGALGHDLTVGSLRQNWRGPEQSKDVWEGRVHPIAVGDSPKPATYKQASAELKHLTEKLPRLNARQLADVGHSVANALAAQGKTVEARDAGRLAGARQAGMSAPKRMVLGAGLLALALDTESESGEAAKVVRQLMGTYMALKRAHHLMALNRTEGTTMTEQDERQRPLTRQEQAQQRLNERQERRAARPPLWDATTIRGFIVQDTVVAQHPGAFVRHEPVQPVGAVQATRIVALGTALYGADIIKPDYINALNLADATALERQLENGLGPEKVKLVDERRTLSIHPEAPAQQSQAWVSPAEFEAKLEASLGAEKVAAVDSRLAQAPVEPLTPVMAEFFKIGPEGRLVPLTPAEQRDQGAKVEASTPQTTLERLGYTTPGEAVKVSPQGIPIPKVGWEAQAADRPDVRERSTGMKPARDWVTFAEPVTAAQRGRLIGLGVDPKQVDSLVKGAASLVIDKKTDLAGGQRMSAEAREKLAAEKPAQAPAQNQAQDSRNRNLDAQRQQQERRQRRA